MAEEQMVYEVKVAKYLPEYDLGTQVYVGQGSARREGTIDIIQIGSGGQIHYRVGHQEEDALGRKWSWCTVEELTPVKVVPIVHKLAAVSPQYGPPQIASPELAATYDGEPTIGQIREAKAALEQEINRALVEFRERYGVQLEPNIGLFMEDIDKGKRKPEIHLTGMVDF